MGRPASIHQRVFASIALACLGAAWSGCTTQPVQGTGGATSSSTTAGAGGIGGATSTASTTVTIDSGSGGEDPGTCTSTSATAQHVPLDIIFLIDHSLSMVGAKWVGTTAALKAFFNDPASANVGAGLTFFPSLTSPTCNPVDYQVLQVPIGKLPGNAFALTNAIPAEPKGNSTPTYGAVKGALQAATAYQDAHPTHKVILVLATDGDPNSCGMVTIDHIADLAKSARSYNGVLTYVIAVAGSILPNLNKIAASGGTGAAYDITLDVTQFFAKIAEIRSVALGCDFAIPPPPNGEQLDPDRVNFTYTPKGIGTPKTLLRADDLADCGGKPGWYYDSNAAPTKIVLCPASCTTVTADNSAKVEALFGCTSLVN